jgi:hypothetical protein
MTCQHGVGKAPNALAAAHEGGQHSDVAVPGEKVLQFVTVGRGWRLHAGQTKKGCKRNF